jgi:GlpG protein
MRQIGTVASEQEAHTFRDYLLTQNVTVTVEDEDARGWVVWIHDEDHVDLARRELAEFIQSPDAEKYRSAAEKAVALRREREKQAKQVQKKIVDVRRKWERPIYAQCPLTIGMIIISVVVAFGSRLGEVREPLVTALSIASFESDGRLIYWKGLQDILSGQIWRLVTPIFIHFTFLHILFNMMWLRELGMVIEYRRGTGRFLAIVLTIAVTSNVAQYWLGGGPNIFAALVQSPLEALRLPIEALRGELRGSPTFGGMSGVVFGLFGYIWMKSRFDPISGFFMPSNLVFLMIAWFFFCMTGWVGNIANTAHGVGLASGAALGYAPVLWRNMTR